RSTDHRGSPSPGRRARRGFRAASQARSEAGLRSLGRRCVEADGGGHAHRTDRSAINPGREHRNKKLAIKARIATTPGAIECFTRKAENPAHNCGPYTSSRLAT